MDQKIIELAKKFVGTLKKNMKPELAQDVFVISVRGETNEAENVAVSLYTDVKVGSMARKKMPEVYKKADYLLAEVHANYQGITSVVILLTNEYQTEVFQDKKVLRISNLDA